MLVTVIAQKVTMTCRITRWPNYVLHSVEIEVKKYAELYEFDGLIKLKFLWNEAKFWKYYKKVKTKHHNTLLFFRLVSWKRDANYSIQEIKKGVFRNVSSRPVVAVQVHIGLDSWTPPFLPQGPYKTTAKSIIVRNFNILPKFGEEIWKRQTQKTRHIS